MNFKYPLPHVNADMLNKLSVSGAGQDLFVIALLQGVTQGTWLEIGAGCPIEGSNTYLLEKFFGFSGTSVDIVDCADQAVTPYQKTWERFYRNIRAESWPTSAAGLVDLSSAQQQECLETHGYSEYVETFKTDIDGLAVDQRSWTSMRPNTDFQLKSIFDVTSFPSRVDYLQIDINPPINNLRALEHIITQCEFSVLTFEHDIWRGTEEVAETRMQSRQLLESHGYELLVNDVSIDPEFVRLGNESVVCDPSAPIKHFEDWWVNPKQIPREVIDAYKWIDFADIPKFSKNILFNS
jgi:hypothetical protein